MRNCGSRAPGIIQLSVGIVKRHFLTQTLKPSNSKLYGRVHKNTYPAFVQILLILNFLNDYFSFILGNVELYGGENLKTLHLQFLRWSNVTAVFSSVWMFKTGASFLIILDRFIFDWKHSLRWDGYGRMAQFTILFRITGHIIMWQVHILSFET